MNTIIGHNIKCKKPYNLLGNTKYNYYFASNYNKLTIFLSRNYNEDWKIYSELLYDCRQNNSMILMISYKDLEIDNIYKIIDQDFLSFPIYIIGRKETCKDSIILANFLFSNNLSVKNVCQIENVSSFESLNSNIKTLIIDNKNVKNFDYLNYELLKFDNLTIYHIKNNLSFLFN